MVDEGEDGGCVRCDEGSVRGCAAVREVVGEQEGVVIFADQVTDPVVSVRGRVAWEGGIADWV